jgi:hypothetical protein
MLRAYGDQVVGDDRAARFGTPRHGQELLGLAPVWPLERDGEQPVVGLQRVVLGSIGSPQLITTACW